MVNRGCLMLNGECDRRMQALEARLRENGIGTVNAAAHGSIQDSALDGLRRARGREQTMITASGETVWVALALAARMNVDRLVLIDPRPAERAEMREIQFFAARNLFFCVSDVLVIGSDNARAFDKTVKKLLNSRVWRMNGAKNTEIIAWSAEFLICEDFSKCESEHSAQQA